MVYFVTKYVHNIYAKYARFIFIYCIDAVDSHLHRVIHVVLNANSLKY